MSATRRVRRDERGSALLIALAFLGLLSLFVAATLTAAEGGLHAGASMQVQPKRMYSADGAVEQAIQAIRYDKNLGRDDGVNCTKSAPLKINGRDVYVECTAQDGSGLSQLGGSSPELGIIAFSNGLGNEAGYQQTGNSIVRLDGGLYSHSTLRFIKATGGECGGSDPNCPQLNLCPKNKKTIENASYISVPINGTPTNVVSVPAAEFSDTPTNTDVGAPISANSGIPTGAKIAGVYSPTTVWLDKAPTGLAAGGRTITIREDFPQLQKHCHQPAIGNGTLTALLGPCDRGRTVAIRFNCKDGTLPVVGDANGNYKYYPPDEDKDADPNFVDRTVPACGTGNVVELNPGRYVSAAAFNNNLKACDKVIWFKPGTYFFDFPNADAAWTIGLSSNKAQTIVAGAKTWIARPNGQETFTATSKNNSNEIKASSSVFTSADVGKYISSGYNVPFGTKITQVLDGGSRVLLNKNATGAATSIFIVHSQDSLCEGRTTFDHPGAEFIFGGESRMIVEDSRTEICSPVDGNKQQIAIYGPDQLEVGSELKVQSGCATAQPYPSVGCATIKTSGPKPMFLIHGTVYIPSGVFDLGVQTVSYQIVSRGILARVIAVAISPSADFKDPLIFSPNFGSVVGAPRRVLFEACEDKPCSAGGTKKLRALARYEDTEPNSSFVSVGNRVFIESWTVLR